MSYIFNYLNEEGNLVYRSDQRDPSFIFQNGFQKKHPNQPTSYRKLFDTVNGISTTLNFDQAIKFPFPFPALPSGKLIKFVELLNQQCFEYNRRTYVYLIRKGDVASEDVYLNGLKELVDSDDSHLSHNNKIEAITALEIEAEIVFKDKIPSEQVIAAIKVHRETDMQKIDSGFDSSAYIVEGYKILEVVSNKNCNLTTEENGLLETIKSHIGQSEKISFDGVSEFKKNTYFRRAAANIFLYKQKTENKEKTPKELHKEFYKIYASILCREKFIKGLISDNNLKNALLKIESQLMSLVKNFDFSEKHYLLNQLVDKILYIETARGWSFPADYDKIIQFCEQCINNETSVKKFRNGFLGKFAKSMKSSIPFRLTIFGDFVLENRQKIIINETSQIFIDIKQFFEAKKSILEQEYPVLFNK